MNWLWWALLAIAMSGIWGIVAKNALSKMTWQQFMFWDMVTYVVLMGATVLLSRQKIVMGPAMWWAVAACAIGFVSLLAGNIALQRGRASVVVPVMAVYPALTMVLAIPLLGEHVTATKVIGVMMAVGAVVLLSDGSE